MVKRRRYLHALGLSALAGCRSVPSPTDPANEGTTGSADARASRGVGRDAWSMVGFDAANTGYNPTASGPTEAVGERWRAPLAGNWAPRPPSIVDGTVYTGGQSVSAIDIGDGSDDWVWNAPGHSSLFTGCAVVDSVVYANSCIKDEPGDLYDHYLHRLDPD